MTVHDSPWQSMTVHDSPWQSMKVQFTEFTHFPPSHPLHVLWFLFLKSSLRKNYRYSWRINVNLIHMNHIIESFLKFIVNSFAFLLLCDKFILQLVNLKMNSLHIHLSIFCPALGILRLKEFVFVRPMSFYLQQYTYTHKYDQIYWPVLNIFWRYTVKRTILEVIIILPYPLQFQIGA